MTSINRGSQHKLVGIAEATYGVTPATPAMTELPVVSFEKTSTQGSMLSDQLRSHPYVDRILTNGLTHDLVVTTEMQDVTHDLLYQTMFANTIVSKSMKFADALASMSLESQAGGGSGTALFDDFTGSFFNKLDVSLAASDTAPVKAVFTGQAVAAALDATTTIASSVTAAPQNDPFIYADGTITIAGVSRPVTSANFSVTREITGLDVLGTRVSRYYVPGSVSLTGSLSIPYEDALESARFTAFADNAIVLKCANQAVTQFRQFTIPTVKILKLARPVSNRGGIIQNIDFTAHYDSTSATVMTLTTE